VVVVIIQQENRPALSSLQELRNPFEHHAVQILAFLRIVISIRSVHNTVVIPYHDVLNAPFMTVFIFLATVAPCIPWLMRASATNPESFISSTKAMRQSTAC
jgi:hypothetical protein